MTGGGGSWSTSWDCNGGNISFSIFCIDDQWYFNLISNGTNFANPSILSTGGCTLRSCSPFEVDANISISGWDCDTIGQPCDCGSPDTLNSFSAVVTE